MIKMLIEILVDMFKKKCVHPANKLIVHNHETVEIVDEDFDIMTYHLKCDKCGELINIKHSKLRCSPLEFLTRV